MDRIEPGQVICYTCMQSDRAYPTPHIWVLVIKPAAGILLKGQFTNSGRKPGDRVMILSRLWPPGKRVVPPEEWPDDVCAMVARYQLTGKIE